VASQLSNRHALMRRLSLRSAASWREIILAGTVGLQNPSVPFHPSEQRSPARHVQTGIHSDYSKLKAQNVLKIPKNNQDHPSHPRMKKLLLVATVLVGGLTISSAGINISIGLPLPPLPRPAIVIRHPAPYCPPPVYVAPPICPPRVVITRPPVYYHPGYGYHKQHSRGYDRWDRHGRGHSHRR
jgi:hypothetical protein